MTELGYFKNFFTGINFHTLVPDQNHTLLTGGYGTYNDNNLHLSQVDYATAAKSSDGSLAVIYTPVAHTLTVAMGNFSGPVTAKWFDPTNATFQTVAGSPFPNSGSHNFTTPGNNSAGDPDWVLLLQAASGSPTPTPTATATFTPTPTPTATAHGHRHSNGYCNCNSNRNGYSNGDSNLKSQSYADAYTNSYNNTCADSHAYRNAYSNIDTYPQRHTKA